MVHWFLSCMLPTLYRNFINAIHETDCVPLCDPSKLLSRSIPETLYFANTLALTTFHRGMVDIMVRAYFGAKKMEMAFYSPRHLQLTGVGVVVHIIWAEISFIY